MRDECDIVVVANVSMDAHLTMVDRALEFAFSGQTTGGPLTKSCLFILAEEVERLRRKLGEGQAGKPNVLGE